MLAHVLKVEGITKQQLAKLLYAIVCALEERKNFMLHESGYVLRDNFIFIGMDWSDVYLTYVPLTERSDEVTLLAKLHLLIEQLASRVREEDQLQAAAWANSFSIVRDLQSCKEKLLNAMDDTKDAKPRELLDSLDKMDSATSFEDQYGKEQNKDHQAERQLGQEHQEDPQKMFSSLGGNRLPKPLLNRKVEFSMNPAVHEEKEIPVPLLFSSIEMPEVSKTSSISISFFKSSKRSEIIFLVGVLLIIAFLWQNYFTYPSLVSFRITLGLTILLLDGCLVIKFMGFPRLQPLNRSLSKGYSLGGQQPQINEDLPASPSINIKEHYENLYRHTTLLKETNPNVTTFLGSKERPPAGARLEVLKEGISQTFNLENSSSFTIGRGDSEAKVDYAMQEAGISRLHAEIIKEGDTYGIKDLGSTNGTFLNGEQLVSYQSYGLKDGDKIQLLYFEFTFRE
ncbi:FHA domain-containing protein [Paenibacillus sp. SYP-B3998]|uniref:FHA domain-containing protein n=2 Tax=Paenibacillus sp. SYP-B3998 TaxID=2678564 RepID=A0A6G3ZWK7_9BACL|nr:FHA domain-containing protein [Paenibacillus sp. SYP-B3998]